MTVIQTVAGGAGGSGQAIDLRNEELSISGSSYTGQLMLYVTTGSGSAELDINIDGKRILTNNYLVERVSSIPGYKKDVDTTVIDTVTAWLENILPGLSDGVYRITTVGCGIPSTGLAILPYWTLTVSGGVYSLAYSGSSLYQLDTNPIKLKVITIGRIP